MNLIFTAGARTTLPRLGFACRLAPGGKSANPASRHRRKERGMSTAHRSYLSMLAASLLGTALFIAAPMASAQPAANAAVQVKADEIGGVVTGAKGPEAGVWVIAETKDLPTKYVRIVVTDDQGRYLIPSLPKANYDVFVRGYGLVDSPRTKTP